MPGVVVTTATRSGPSAPLRAPSGQFFIAGLSERGDTNAPTLVRGMADVDRLLGGRTTYGAVYDQLKTYFDEGGQQAYVARVVGSGASVGTLTLTDRATTPIPTLRVDAANEGAWSTRVSVEVRAGGLANTVRIVVRIDGVVVQDISNILSPNDAVAKFSGSPYIKVTDLGSATAAPENLPDIDSATPLSAGADARGSVVAADYIAALAQFMPGLGDGCVAIPGQTGNTIWQGIVDHCVTHQRIGLLASTQNETVDNLFDQAGSVDTEYAGLFAPWIQVSDNGTGVRTISPEGFVAAKRAQVHASDGPWRAPAGAAGKGTSILGLSEEYTADVGNELDAARVNVIRRVAGSYRLYGWRSLSSDVQNYTYLKDRDVLNRLVVEASLRLEDYVFAPIDRKGQLLSSINAELVGMVEPIRQLGGLYERYDSENNMLDPGYKVETGSEVNTEVSLANNEVRARLLVRVAPTGGLVMLDIVKVGLLAGI